ncbi:unnamed protein product [Ranitomeya imitator]|uniref:5-hydroxytryptamine receptor 3B n=1 Tax=Ranitomeya imitator TaxID=111125 RepID=A0ABN9LJ70_9NEOB|nr:unnamed protein product [Ranitomeya imitator]
MADVSVTVILLSAAALQTFAIDVPQIKNSSLLHLTTNLLINYRKSVRPVKNWSQATMVYIDLFVHAVLDVDGQNQKLTTSIWYRQMWKDEFLAWNSSQFDGIGEISLPLNAIWVPDIVINEFVEDGKSPDLPYVYVSSSGTIRNYKPMQVVSACSLETYAFPFDIQNCSLTFTSCLHTVLKSLPHLLPSQPYPKRRSSGTGTGEYRKCRGSAQDKRRENSSLSFVGEDICRPTLAACQEDVELVIRRRPLLYIVGILVPSILLMIVDLMSFYLPPDSGTRIMFKTSILVGYTVFRVNMAGELPATTLSVPLIGVFFLVCMALMVLSLGKSIVVIKFLHIDKDAPGVLLISQCLMLTRRRHGQYDDNTEDNSMGSTNETAESLCGVDEVFQSEAIPDDPLMEQILQEVTSIRSYVQEMDSEETWHSQWLNLCYKLDSVMFRAYLLLFTAYAATLTFLWWAWSSYTVHT